MTPSAQSVFVYSQIFSVETDAKTEAGMQNKMNMHTDRDKIKRKTCIMQMQTAESQIGEPDSEVYSFDTYSPPFCHN